MSNTNQKLLVTIEKMFNVNKKSLNIRYMLSLHNPRKL